MLEKLLIPEADLADGIIEADVKDIPFSQHGIEGQLHEQCRLADAGMGENGAEAPFRNHVVGFGSHPPEWISNDQIIFEHRHIPVFKVDDGCGIFSQR
jgi:hypothetical protein